MLDERLAGDRPGAGHHVQAPVGQPGLVEDVREQVRDQRRVFGRLEYHGAAGRERGRDLRDDLMQRVVPRRDRADHADGLANHERVTDPLAAEVVASQQLDVAGEYGQRRADLDLAREGQRRAHVGADRRRYGVGALLQQLPRRVQPLSTLRDWRRRPSAERSPRRANRVVYVGRMTGWHPVDDRLVSGIDDIDALWVGRRRPCAVDVVAAHPCILAYRLGRR